VKFNRLRKIIKKFPFTYYRSWQGAFWLIFEKLFSFVFFHGVKIENAEPPMEKYLGKRKTGKLFRFVRDKLR
jgi:hypothetical protein